MKKILSRFVIEHERSKTHLNFFNDAVNRIIRDGFNPEDLEILKNSHCYLEKETGEHCRREEVSVYPGLSTILSSSEIYEMKYEHEKIKESLEKIKAILCRIELHGSSEALLVKLKVDAKFFVNLLSNHIIKEDGYFFILARNSLTGKDLNHVFRMRKEKL